MSKRRKESGDEEESGCGVSRKRQFPASVSPNLANEGMMKK